jgi:hypothetical protein
VQLIIDTIKGDFTGLKEFTSGKYMPSIPGDPDTKKPSPGTKTPSPPVDEDVKEKKPNNDKVKKDHPVKPEK